MPRKCSLAERLSRGYLTAGRLMQELPMLIRGGVTADNNVDFKPRRGNLVSFCHKEMIAFRK